MRTQIAILLMSAAVSAQTTLFTLSGTSTGTDKFGWSSYDAGDVNDDNVPDFVVGAYADDTNGYEAGAVFVFSGVDGSTLHAIYGANAGDRLGLGVASAGDVDDDGHTDFIAGIDGDDTNGDKAGAAAVFSGLDGSVIHMVYGDAADDRFGLAVNCAGDVDQDGHMDFIVGAPGGLGGQGYARVFSGQDASILHTFQGALALGIQDRLGTSVNNAGDVNYDGVPDVIVGAPGALGTGQATVYSGADGSILHQVQGANAFDRLGIDVDDVGDIDFDGFGDFLVGAYGDDTQVANGGYARVHSGFDGSILFNFHSVTTDDEFGGAVAGAGDVDGDNVPDIVIGANRTRMWADDNGAAWVFSGLTGEAIYMLDGVPGSHFGYSVSRAGDVTGSGNWDILVGAPATTGPGAAYVVSLGPPAPGDRLGPYGRGTVGAVAGVTPIDVLFIDGSAGGADRRVDLLVNQPFSMILSHPVLPTSAFALFGVSGVPAISEANAWSLFAGGMCFKPCFLDPAADQLFTLANNLGPGPCGAMTSSTPAPWFLNVPAGVPFPFKVTLQGIMQDLGTGYAFTNGVILDIQ